MEEKFIDWLAEAASKVRDIRICFNILLTAGLLAEYEKKTKLEHEHFKNATKTNNTLKTQKLSPKTYLKPS